MSGTEAVCECLLKDECDAGRILLHILPMDRSLISTQYYNDLLYAIATTPGALCVAVDCDVLQRVATRSSVLHCVAVSCSVLRSVLQCVAVCCSVL